MSLRARNFGFSFPSALGRILLDPEGGDGGGNGNPPTPTPTPAPEAGRGEAFIKKHGSAAEAVDVLLSEGHRNREKIRDLEAKVPPAGSRVLSPDEVRTYDSLLSLGPVDEVKRKVRDFDGLDARVKSQERVDRLNAVAEDARVDGKPVNSKVLATLAGDLLFETKTVKVDGKDQKQVFVKHKDAEGKDAETAFDAYAASHWKDFLPSLAPAPAEANGEGNGRPRGTPTRTTPPPATGGTGSGNGNPNGGGNAQAPTVRSFF